MSTNVDEDKFHPRVEKNIKKLYVKRTLNNTWS